MGNKDFSDYGFDGWLNEMKKDKFWCEENMMKAASIKYRRPIITINENGDITPPQAAPEHWGYNINMDNPIYLGYIQNTHYVATRRVNRTGKDIQNKSLPNKTSQSSEEDPPPPLHSEAIAMPPAEPSEPPPLEWQAKAQAEAHRKIIARYNQMHADKDKEIAALKAAIAEIEEMEKKTSRQSLPAEDETKDYTKDKVDEVVNRNRTMVEPNEFHNNYGRLYEELNKLHKEKIALQGNKNKTENIKRLKEIKHLEDILAENLDRFWLTDPKNPYPSVSVKNFEDYYGKKSADRFLRRASDRSKKRLTIRPGNIKKKNLTKRVSIK